MIHGILNVYKEQGYTSHDVVAKLRGITKQKKIGHTGTLDPDAEGVLPICLGSATKICSLLTDRSKTYRTVLLLGQTTDTQDVSGSCLESQSVSHLTESQVKEAILKYEGEYEQVPPMYSALKVNGKKLYELAREGKTVERSARKVVIHDIKIEKIELPRVWMEVSCSKGTYIRTLCNDIGGALGTGGCMEKLKRTRVGELPIENSLTLGEIQNHMEEGTLNEILLPVDHFFRKYRKITVGKEEERFLYNGNSFFIPHLKEKPDDKELVRMYNREGNFIALYRYSGKTERFETEKMFLNDRQ